MPKRIAKIPCPNCGSLELDVHSHDLKKTIYYPYVYRRYHCTACKTNYTTLELRVLKTVGENINSITPEQLSKLGLAISTNRIGTNPYSHPKCYKINGKTIKVVDKDIREALEYLLEFNVHLIADKSKLLKTILEAKRLLHAVSS